MSANKDAFLQRLQEKIDAENAEKDRLERLQDATRALFSQVEAWCEDIDRVKVEPTSVAAGYGTGLKGFRVSFMNQVVSFIPSANGTMPGWVGIGSLDGLRLLNVSLRLNSDDEWILVSSSNDKEQRYGWSEDTFFGMLTEAR